MFQRSLRQLSTNQCLAPYDVIISGGGMVGSTMALALGKNPAFKDYRIALIEASPKKIKSTKSNLAEYSNRVSAINPSSKDLFSDLGVWQNFRRCQVVQDMKVWGAYTDDTINYKDDSRSTADIAYIIENDDIVQAVAHELDLVENVEIIYGARITNVEMETSNNSRAHVALNNGDAYQCRLLIGADGANSEVRKSMGVQYLSYSYNQTAIVGTLNILEQENVTAWQRFLPSGPIALLPLNSRISSLVWSTSHEKAETLMALPDDSFVDSINDAFHSKPINDTTVATLKSILRNSFPSKQTKNVPRVCSVVESSRASFPLGFGHATNYVKPNVVLIGDAAHKVHPLAGQGVNLGFRDIHNLTGALFQGLQCGRELGDFRDLNRYQQVSQRANLPIMLAIDMIYRIYTSENSLIRALGCLGIHLTEELPPIKNMMRRVASS